MAATPPSYDNKAYPPPQQGYPPQPGYAPQPSYPPQPGYPPQPAYPSPQPAYPPPAPQAQQQQQVTVINTGASAPPPAPVTIIRETQVQPNDYLVAAILLTLCCFLPTGIVAIVFALKVRSLFDSGDTEGARQASSSARTWCIVTLIVGILAYVVIVIANVASTAATSAAVASSIDDFYY